MVTAVDDSSLVSLFKLKKSLQISDMDIVGMGDRLNAIQQNLERKRPGRSFRLMGIPKQAGGPLNALAWMCAYQDVRSRFLRENYPNLLFVHNFRDGSTKLVRNVKGTCSKAMAKNEKKTKKKKKKKKRHDKTLRPKAMMK